MRKHLLTVFGMAVDGLIAALFGVEAFYIATAALGLVCAYAYRIELQSTYRFVLGKSGPPWGGKHAALQNPGGGIHIAKLLSRTKSRSEAEDILDIFIDAPIKVNEGAVYAAYAAALVRFGDLVNAGEVLIAADRKEGMSKEELDAFMDRFYYPKERGEKEQDG